MSSVKQETKEEEHLKSNEASSPESSGRKSPGEKKLHDPAHEGTSAP